MGFKVKEIQPTPNPNAAKFVLDGQISAQPMSFLTPQQGASHPIAAQLFAIKGVTSVLLLGDFVTVNKQSDVKWDAISSRVQEILQNVPGGGR